jgi:hypothetical protein
VVLVQTKTKKLATMVAVQTLNQEPCPLNQTMVVVILQHQRQTQSQLLTQHQVVVEEVVRPMMVLTSLKRLLAFGY